MFARRIATVICAVLSAAAFALTASAAADDLKVVVTIKPAHAIVAAVMQGVATPELLVDGVASPHTFAMKPSDARRVNAAHVFIRVSESLEPFTARLARSLPGSVRVVTLASVPGLTLHKLRTGGSFEAHAHAEKSHGHGHSHGKSDTDGHIWLDPENAKLIAKHVAEVLGSLRPADAGRMRSNAEQFAAEVSALSREIEARLKPVSGRPYLVFHDAYQYFERRYGLTPVGSVTVSPEVPPSARRLMELRGKIASLQAVCIFAEPQFAPKVIETIAEGTTARKGVLDPLGAALPAGPGHYAALLRALAEDLAGCLANPS
jgi:zinc transport system substrate-binding protein